ncbi:polysaccharide deacetylase family protein [Candidatus Omnitrophota bacterium]
MNLRRIFKIFGVLIIIIIVGCYLYIRPKYQVPILMYHHVDHNGGQSSLSVSPENFKRQMRFLAKRDYNVISLSELVQALKNEDKLPPNSLVITFDDGYLDNYTIAYPELKKHDLPATMFVIVDKIGQPGYLTDRQIQQMAGSGLIEIGSHSLSGAYLPGRDLLELEREISQSKLDLELKLNRAVRFFCYPIGGYTAQIQKIVKDSGYQAACSTNRGKISAYLNNDIYALKRIKVRDGFANLFVFWVKISGYYNSFRSVVEPHK